MRDDEPKNSAIVIIVVFLLLAILYGGYYVLSVGEPDKNDRRGNSTHVWIPNR